uniref:Uncharacterized protein n=1 Tax=Trypanosoma congolense (strain IL3000) TaxID=1068625 RepID=G0US22_TRYCI|nr:conserved hypothetical protein [Trypanosoma congolense IL3000]
MGAAGNSIVTCMRRSLSMIITVLMATCTCAYAVCMAIIMHREKRLSVISIPHIFSIILCGASVYGYGMLHCVSQRNRYLLHIITLVLICALCCIGQSIGLTSLTIYTCDDLGLINVTNFDNLLEQEPNFPAADEDVVVNNTTSEDFSVRPVRHCMLNTAAFMCAIINALLQIFALFDVQKVLLEKEKERTYGMGLVESAGCK